EVFLRTIEHRDFDAFRGHLLDPGRAGELGATPGMAALLELLERLLGGLGHVGLLHHHEAAHVHNRRDVLDEDRALLHAGAAGHAVPDRLEADALDEIPRLAALAAVPARGGRLRGVSTRDAG